MSTTKEGEGRSRRLSEKLRQILDTHPVIFTTVLALVLTLVIEMVSRHSPIKGIVFPIRHPINFLANYFIVLTTVSLGHLFKKRTFFLTFFSFFWLAAGVVNGVVLAFRVTPFGTIDLSLLPSVFTIITVYMEWWQIIAAGVIIAATIAGLTVVYIKSKRCPVNYRMASVLIAASCLLAVGAYSLTVVGHEEERADNFANIADAYKTYGFVYCFSTGAVDRGVSEPDFYSRPAVNWLVGNIKDTPEPEAETLPNIIMIQLESFFDVSYLDDVDLSETPIPNFTRMKRTCSSGFLSVPSVGAGTANTEFEVLSGMDLDFFGMGEYPYKTILQEEACESVVRDLKALGYTGTAIHNNTGTFYDRNEVFAQLGFDSFVSIEYMDDVDYNPIGWARDECLTGEIIKALDASPEQDFIFTITVQGHGKYQRGVDSVDAESLNIAWATEREDEDAFGYYMSQLKETDEFIGELTAALRRRAEPTVVVLYGDHLPSFDIGSEQLKNGDIFQTEYVVWSNFPMKEQDMDLEAYQLSARVLEQLDMSPGLLTKYHQQMHDTEDYLDGLSLLEYDMLYGDFYCYGGENPYTATELKMGVEPVVITGYELDSEQCVLRVTGRNFTDWSVIYIDGEALETTREGDTLTAAMPELAEPEFADSLAGSVLTVHQDTSVGLSLSESVGLVID